MPTGLHVKDSGIYVRIISRRLKGESLSAFANRVGLRRTLLHHWKEDHQTGIGIISIQRFVEATGVSYDWLITGKEGPVIAATQEEARQAVKELESRLEHLSGILSRVEVEDADV